MRNVSARIFTHRRASPRGCHATDPSDTTTGASDSHVSTRGEKLTYALWDSSRDTRSDVPEDVREIFLDFYARAYDVYVRRWSDGHSSVHYVRKKTIPPFVELRSPRSLTCVHVDLSGLPVDIPADTPMEGVERRAGFTVHCPPFL